MASKNVKKGASTIRANSAVKEGQSVAEKKPPIVVWPEWSDGDINAEKWDVQQKGKEKDKGKSPGASTLYFEDPEGRVELPPTLHAESWRRPGDDLLEKPYVVVDPEGYNAFDLLSMNEHIFDSELMRWLVGQIIALWQMTEIKNSDGTPGGVPVNSAAPQLGEYTHSWRPWEHIYSINKVGKEPNMPVYNPCGKYAVRLYWLGSWRKIIVDDSIPYDDQNRPLLPVTTLSHELWPMILTKALLKIASLDMNGGISQAEFGDFSVIHCLTSWIPEAIPLQMSIMQDMWGLIKSFLPEFKLPEQKPEDPLGEDGISKSDANTPLEGIDGKEKTMNTEKTDKTADKKKGEEKKKDDVKNKKGGDKEKEKTKKQQEKSLLNQDEAPLPEHPEVVIFASYNGPPKYPVKMATLREMANASETLRQKGLSHLYPHPVLLTQTRSCPLEPPPPPEVIPKWKLIRPRRKKTLPSDEPREELTVEDKPIMSVQINSPFINYKVSPIPIPTDTTRPRSSLERGQSRTTSRPGTANVDPIDENEEFPSEQELKSQQGANGIKKKKMSISTSSAKSKGPEPMPSAKRKETLKLPELDKHHKKGSTTGAADDFGGVPPEAQESEMQIEEPPAPPPPTNKSASLWMDFEEFCRCFKTLYIYHKPHTYPHNQKFLDMKSITSTKDGKKTNPNTAAQGVEEKSPQFILVDSLKPSELIFAYTALSRWPEPPVMTTNKEDSKAEIKGPAGKGKGDKGLEKEPTKLEAQTTDSGSLIMVQPPETRVVEKLQPGLITAEPYSWKSLVSGQPVLRMRTTGTKCSALQLPPGRHVLRINMTAPLAYHVHVCSTTQFSLAEEDKIMAEITKESCRFVETAHQLMSALQKVIMGFTDAELMAQAWEEFYDCHCPYRSAKSVSKQHHWKLLKEAFYSVLKKYLAEVNLATAEVAQAWRCFFFDCTTPNPLGLQFGTSSRPTTSAPVPDRSSAGKGTKSSKAPKQAEKHHKEAHGEQHDPKLEQWKFREVTPQQHVAAIKIQKIIRGYLVRRIQSGCSPGTDDNVKAQETLFKIWTQVLEPNAEQIGLAIFRAMFKLEPDLLPFYSFYKDEWNKVSYLDIQGSYPDQPANTWFVIYRDVFTVNEDMLVAPKLYSNLSTASLRVINNDTGEDIPRVFHKVAPHIYKKNKRGYTFYVEGRSVDNPLPSGRWRIRLIGSMTPLPIPSKSPETPISFHAREIRDHYIPNDKNLICKYNVKVMEDHLASLQMSTSSPEVYLRLQVMDGNVELLSAEGRGHVVLPAFMFSKNVLDDGNRTPSRASNKESKTKGVTIKQNRRSSSAASQNSKKSLTSDEDDDHDREEKAKMLPQYVIQAIVLRNTWKLTDTEAKFVEQLRWQEKEEMKANYDPGTAGSTTNVSTKERTGSPPPKDTAKAAGGGKVAGKAKDAKGGKGGKEKAAEKKEVSRPPSQQLELNKPNYLLRVVSEANAIDDLDIRKDTSRLEEIRAIKRAWEEAEPGRAAKAIQSRMQYLNTHLIKPPVPSDEDLIQAKEVSEQSPSQTDSSVDPAASANVVKQRLLPTKEDLIPLDITPFIRKTLDTPILRNEDVEKQQQEELVQKMQEFKLYWEGVERRRQEERLFRNNLKIEQIQMCTKMQLDLDKAREEIFAPREAYRQKLMETEKKKLEEQAAKEAELLQQLEAEKAKQAEGKKSAKNSAKKKK